MFFLTVAFYIQGCYETRLIYPDMEILVLESFVIMVSPIRELMKDDFPHPILPRIPINCPCLIFKFMSERTYTRELLFSLCLQRYDRGDGESFRLMLSSCSRM